MHKTHFLILNLFFLIPAHAARYTSHDRRFHFEYDETKWEIVGETPAEKAKRQDVDQVMAQKTLVTLQRKDADDKYHARFSVVADSLAKFKGAKPDELSAYRKHALQFMENQRFHIQTSNDLKLSRVPGPAFEILANQRDFGLTFRQVVFLRGPEAYLLTTASRTAKFVGYRPETEKFFDTFQFTE